MLRKVCSMYNAGMKVGIPLLVASSLSSQEAWTTNTFSTEIYANRQDFR